MAHEADIGIERASYLAVASFTFLLYEYAITLDDEIRYFWSGPWSISRILYLINRYFPIAVMVLTLSTFFGVDMSATMCKINIQAAIAFSFLAVLIIQGILVLRTYYLYSHSLLARVFVICVYLTTTVAAAIFITLVLLSIEAKERPVHVGQLVQAHLGCALTSSTKSLWPFFIPTLTLHTILYCMSSYRAMTAKSSTPVLKRLRRDGGLFYLVVLISVGLSGIGAFLRHIPTVNVPAVYSNFMLAVTSASISRVMLSIHSLAAKIGTDPEWLLSNLELSRVRWTKGSHDAELIVEVDAVDYDEWESAIDDFDMKSYGRSGPAANPTNVGAVDAYYAGTSAYPYSYY
jgi:hypothetical protein